MMHVIRAFTPCSLCLVGLASCGSTQVVRQIPPQWSFRSESGGASELHLEISRPLSGFYILSGILPGEPSSPWRWCQKTVEFQLPMQGIRPIEVSLVLLMAERILQEVGPLNLDIRANGSSVAAVRLAAAGEVTVKFSVPRALLAPNGRQTIGFSSDKVWTAERDGAELSVLIKELSAVESSR